MLQIFAASFYLATISLVVKSEGSMPEDFYLATISLVVKSEGSMPEDFYLGIYSSF